jgi:hypothetical protein
MKESRMSTYLTADRDLGPEYFIPVSIYEEEGVDTEALSLVHGGQGSGTYALMSRLSADGETLASMDEITDAISSLEQGLEYTSGQIRRAEEALEEGEEEWTDEELDRFEEELETLPDDYDEMLMSLSTLQWMEREYAEQAAEIEERLLEEEERKQERYREMEEEYESRRRGLASTRKAALLSEVDNLPDPGEVVAKVERVTLPEDTKVSTDEKEKRVNSTKTADRPERLPLPNLDYDADELDDFVDGYVEAAMWLGMTETEEGIGEGDTRFEDLYYDDDITKECMDEIVEDCKDFLFEAAGLIKKAGMSMEQAGHDFYLTRNGHGAGFWDRGLGEVGDKLSDMSRPYGSFTLIGPADGSGPVDCIH